LTLPRANPLRHRRFRTGDLALLEGENRQGSERFPQFTRPEQEIRGGRATETLVADHEGLVDEHSALAQRIDDRVEQRPVQIVGNDDRAEALTGERPGIAGLQVGLHELDAWNVLRLSVDGDYFEPALREEARVAASATRDVENRAALDLRRPAHHPFTWRLWPHGPRGFGAGPSDGSG